MKKSKFDKIRDLAEELNSVRKDIHGLKNFPFWIVDAFDLFYNFFIAYFYTLYSRKYPNK